MGVCNFRLGVKQPIGEMLCSQDIGVIRDEGIFGNLSTVVAESWIGYYLAWIVFCFEKFSCQLILRQAVRSGHVDVAVLGRLESNLCHSRCNVFGGDGLHKHIGYANGFPGSRAVDQGADELEELR